MPFASCGGSASRAAATRTQNQRLEKLAVMFRDVQPILRPRSIAMLGASPTGGMGFTRNIFDVLREAATMVPSSLNRSTTRCRDAVLRTPPFPNRSIWRWWSCRRIWSPVRLLRVARTGYVVRSSTARVR